MKTIFLLFSLLAFPFSSTAAKCDVSTVKQLDAALSSNKQILLLAWSKKDKCENEDEVCGDWADRLNRFFTHQGKSFKIIRVPAKAWKNVVSMGTSDIPKMSSLFIKKGHQSYFYKGPILESDVYAAVMDSWNGTSSSNNAFLPEKVIVSLCK
jgi:hypothetical protein